jgi:sortase (surface protein transpeptidase)
MRRASVLSVVLGGALLIAPPVVWQLAQPPETVGTAPSQAVEQVAEPDTDDGHAARTAAQQPKQTPIETVAEPTRLRIPTLGVDAPLDPVGLEADGGMEIPEDVERVGWYEPGVAPGEEGSAVLSGHVDSRTQGPGVLFELRSIDVDDEVVIETAEGEQRWRVVGRTRYGKQALPVDELFSWEGPPRLVIITCGGDFDPEAGAYEENVVVHAVPA